MYGSGALDKLLGKGFKYMFVSNSDNLGATMDLKLLTHFVDSKTPFMMEVAARTDADKKGGHLARMKEGGGLTLRELAQIEKDKEWEAAFQDTKRYSYFNTNNLWVDLVKLKEVMDSNGGVLPLPVMKNGKTVDPVDKSSTKVIQLETAMGAAISSFQGATAILIPRTRFAPVKKCDDLLALRSDAYVLTEDSRLELHPDRKGEPPIVKIGDSYKFVSQLDSLIPNGVPSLKECKKLEIDKESGPIAFAAGVIIKGKVTIKNSSKDCKTLEAGTYEDKDVAL
jgi:UDP-N-acetylglucosamine pyrophosphorylase